MLDNSRLHSMLFEPISEAQAKEQLANGFEQAVGHPATCEVLTARLGVDVQPVRANVRLNSDDLLIAAQVVVPRLAEGEVLSKEQIEALPLSFWLVREL